eukprot:jgi/Hompol1/3145/HPOL_006372-RA
MRPRDKELVRLMLQSLADYGYSDSVRCLQQESGLVLETPAVNHFRCAVLAGDWPLAERLLSQMEVARPSLDDARFLIKQQKYLELLERQELKRALAVLRNEIAQLNVPQEMLHMLSRHKRAFWSGISGGSRELLLTTLQKFISPSIMIPSNRLGQLMDQAIQLQVSNCLYHNTRNDEISLYADHHCERNSFPVMTTHVLEEHTDEVWFLSFSPDGTMLASASKDARAIIWDARKLSIIHQLEEHSEAISFLAWSYDSTMLLTASNDSTVKLWNSV